MKQNYIKKGEGEGEGEGEEEKEEKEEEEEEEGLPCSAKESKNSMATLRVLSSNSVLATNPDMDTR